MKTKAWLSTGVSALKVKVNLIDGTSKEHNYPMPKTDKEATLLIEKLLNNFMSMSGLRGVKRDLFFIGPCTFYNPDNVTCIELKGLTERQIEQIKKQQETKIIGLRRDK